MTTSKLQFRAAARHSIKARIALYGPSGSGKTYTALMLAEALAQGGKVALVDTENRSSERFADRVTFDVLPLDDYAPETYIEAILLAERAGYAAIVIDSLSHAWAGKGGLRERVDEAKKKYKGNSWSAWADLTPIQNRLVETIVGCRIHVLCTMRSKTAWDTTKDANGQTKPVRIGLEPVQRAELEYEFDLVAQLDPEHNLIVEKARGFEELDGKVIARPGRELGEQIAAWCAGGGPAPEQPKTTQNGNSHKATLTPAERLQKASLAYDALVSYVDVMDEEQADQLEQAGFQIARGEAGAVPALKLLIPLAKALDVDLAKQATPKPESADASNGAGSASTPLPETSSQVPATTTADSQGRDSSDPAGATTSPCSVPSNGHTNGHGTPRLDPLGPMRLEVLGAYTKALEAGLSDQQKEKLPNPALISLAADEAALGNLLGQIEAACGA